MSINKDDEGNTLEPKVLEKTDVDNAIAVQENF